MRDIIKLNAKPTMRQIAADVAAAHGLPRADIYLPIRQKWVAHPRQEAMARMSYAGFSHPRIVRHFGLKDHTTSLHAKRAFEARGPNYRVPLTNWVVKTIKASARAAREAA